MSNYNILKTNIAAQIKQNGAKAITGQILQTHLLSMITSLGAGYQYIGVARLTPSQTDPGTPDYKCFYIATEVGTYSNFGSPALTVAAGEVAIFYYDTAWHKAVTGAASKADVDALIQTLEGEVSELGHEVDEIGIEQIEGDNKFNKNDMTAVNQYLTVSSTNIYNLTTGTSGYRMSNVMNTDAGKTWYIPYSCAGQNTLVFYAKADGTILGNEILYKSSTPDAHTSFTTPANCALMRIRIYDDGRSAFFMVVDNVAKLTPYQDYTLKTIASELSFTAAQIQEMQAALFSKNSDKGLRFALVSDLHYGRDDANGTYQDRADFFCPY